MHVWAARCNSLRVTRQDESRFETLPRRLSMIRHRPEEDVVAHVVEKLDVDHDGYVELEHVLGLAREEGLGIVIENEQTDARNLLGEIKESKPRKEDIVQE